MFTYQTTVRLSDTDATGVLYFTQQLRMALEAFEQFLKERGFGLSKLCDSPYLMPIVHAEADYLSALKVDDEIEISLSVEKIGNRSFSILYMFSDTEGKKSFGTVKLVHAFIKKGESKSTELTPELIEILEGVSAKI